MSMTRTSAVLAIAASMAFAGEAAARETIKIVGSSTVFPFATKVAEQFGKSTEFATPEIESTGSGGGLKLFCAGVGTEHPDITNASRRMKAKEWKLCNDNGVTAIIENVVGYDGIVIANAKSGADFSLTRAQIWTALAAEGPKPAKWSEIDPSLPDIKIEVLGPPPSSGTRDAFEELAMQKGCQKAGNDKSYCKKEGAHIREDGAYVEAGENDNLIVSKLEANPNALGVFGFSFLDQNADKIKGASVDGVAPAFDAIASGDYPVSRTLYFYVKKAHVGIVPGLVEFVAEFTAPETSASKGYLTKIGLIPLPAETHTANRAQALTLTDMTGDIFK